MGFLELGGVRVVFVYFEFDLLRCEPVNRVQLTVRHAGPVERIHPRGWFAESLFKVSPSLCATGRIARSEPAPPSPDLFV